MSEGFESIKLSWHSSLSKENFGIFDFDGLEWKQPINDL